MSEWSNNLTAEPLWPWSLPGVGWIALLAVAGALIGSAVWSYLRVPGTPPRRLAAVIGLRIVALLLILLCVSGISCISPEAAKVPSVVVIALDLSESMGSVKDEKGGTRFEELERILKKECRKQIEDLEKDHKIRVVLYRFGDDVSDVKLDELGAPDGKRTDTAQLFRLLLDKYRGERYLRALIILSDGADNVASDPDARALAARWRNLPSTVHTVTFGNKATTSSQNDIAITALNPDPMVAVKGKLNVRALIDATGFVGSRVRVRVFFDDKEIAAQDEVLHKRKDNPIHMVVDAPINAKPSEVKLTLKVHAPGRDGPLDGEVTGVNNEMSTYFSVASEGVRVLYVDRFGRHPEPLMFARALAGDRRIRVDYVFLAGKERLSPEAKGLFQFDQQPYDVIILGDITPDRLLEADPEALVKIRDRVEKRGAGLLMLGGQFTFGNGGWDKTNLEGMMPVRLNATAVVKTQVKLVPKTDGLAYVLKMADRPEESVAVWEKMNWLNGISDLGDLEGNNRVLGDAKVMASTDTRKPLLVTRSHGAGRTGVLAAYSTHLWVRPKDNGREVHARFWRQLILWLAQKEETQDELQIRPETRRILVGADLHFGVELRGKQGEELRDVQYSIEVVDPRGTPIKVDVFREALDSPEFRGKFTPRLPGEHRIRGTASGKDSTGRDVTGKGDIRFIAYQDDAELREKAANPDFLADLASAGGGQMMRPEGLKNFLAELPTRPLPNPPPRPAKLPDWRATRGRSPFLTAFILLFVQVVALEWFLRRRWGMV